MSHAVSVMLAAGGTAGHLFPAYALAEELARRGVAVDLVTDTRGDRYGTGFPARNTYQVPAATLSSRSPFAVATALWTLGAGVRAAAKVLARVKPAAVVGFGGYPSVPPLVAAWLKRVPAVLHEQNAVLGRANRLLASRVSLIATSFPQVNLLDGAARAKVRLTGNPVRQAVIEQAGRPFAPPEPSYPFHVLVFGGSQGARFFSDCVPPALSGMPRELRGRLRIVQQCRQEDIDRVRASYAEAGISADIAPFFADLPQRMADAHVVIARAGASSVAELAVIGRPSILVPLPHALDNDQLRNATALAESGGAWCIPQEELTAERLAAEMEQLMRNPQKLAHAAAAAKAQGRPDAVVRLADAVMELVRRPDRGAQDRSKQAATVRVI